MNFLNFHFIEIFKKNFIFYQSLIESFVMHILKTLILSIPVGITAVDVVGYIARVDGESMKPTLNPDNKSEYVFLNKVSE